MAKKSRKSPSPGADRPRHGQQTEAGATTVEPPISTVAASPDQTDKPTHERFPVVGIGASAGGLDAFRKFLTAMPGDSGVALILIPHLDPTHQSMMVPLLARHTRLPVCEAEQGMAVQPNRVYVIPPNKFLSISGGVLQLSVPPAARRLETSIDIFLRSLAEDQEDHAIGIILSGTGSHGSQGLKEIKIAGGMIMAQQPESAEYSQMPRSAIATGLIDYVLPPEEMPAAIVAYVRQPWLRESQKSEESDAPLPAQMSDVLALLGTQSKYDFSCYRKSMLLRRVHHRMGLRQIGQLTDYLQCLRGDPDEVMALSKDLLIGVTGFFRDVDVFQLLEQQVIPTLVQRGLERDAQLPSASPGEPDSLPPDGASSVRVWVPGCATGEEAYSIAMLLFERFAAEKRTPRFQVFATDLNDDSLEVARRGIYPEAAVAGLTPERLQQFFVRSEENHFRVSKALRESVVFAPHNLISDAPFSKMDLISCRNLLIYLEAELQRKLIALFHFSLRQDGYLMLGSSETIGRAVDLFETVSKKSRIYRRIGPRRRDLMVLPIGIGENRGSPGMRANSLSRPPAGVVELLNKLLLKKYAPAAVLITRRYEILSLQGPLVNYLEFPPGEPTTDLLAIARQGLAAKIRTLVHTALRTGQSTLDSEIRVKRNGDHGRCRITVTPVNDPKEGEGLLLVCFEECEPPVSSSSAGAAGPMARLESPEAEESPYVKQLQDELKVTTDDLQSTIEELESSNEEFRVSHEEAMSMNEELQSTNEELESSKEELQSLNEELNMVNSQLQEKVEELDKSNCDMTNLMISGDIATLFLDANLCIQRFTPPAARLLNLLDTDIGRPFRDLAPVLEDDLMVADCKQVLERTAPLEREVWSRETHVTGSPESAASKSETTPARRCFLRRIRPYRSSEQLVTGVVITLLDITARMMSEAESHRLATVLRDSNDAVLLLDFDGRITTWNSGAARMYGYSEARALQMNILDIVPKEHHDEMRQLLQRIGRGERVESFESCRITSDGRVLDVWLTVTALLDHRGIPLCVATTERDITNRGTLNIKSKERDALRAAETYKLAEELRAILNAAGDPIITFNRRGIIVRINAAAERNFGYSEKEMLGENISLLIPSSDREQHDEYLRHYLQTAEARITGIGHEVQCLRKDGSIFPAELSISVVDHLGLFTGMIRDLSERRQLQNELLRAVSEEQMRIGQDLHDTAGQELTALRYLIHSHMEFLEKSAGPDLSADAVKMWLVDEIATMRKASDALKGLQKKIRSVIRGLAPVDVDGEGLMSALTDLVASVGELHQLRCDFHCESPIMIHDNFMAKHLYRITQESINNAVKHSGADRISVTLEAEEHGMVLTIHDNGHGFNPRRGTNGRGFGLRIMGYRASLIGARLSVQPGESGGTTVRCQLPRTKVSRHE